MTEDYEFQEFPLNRVGLTDLLSHHPTIAVYEPTGVAYSRVWVERLKEAGVKTVGVPAEQVNKRAKGVRIKLARAYLRRKVSVTLFRALVLKLVP